MFEIALIHPDIPQNTGNIGRLCVGLDVPLHLVRPFGFVLDDKKIRRSGLDYWPHLRLSEHASLTAFRTHLNERRFHLFSTKGKILYTEIQYKKNDILIFGSESRGLPAEFLAEYSSQIVTIPMPGAVRSLNVSNAVACAAYEAYRQLTNNNNKAGDILT